MPGNWKVIFWFVIFSLLLVPLTKSFFVGFKGVVDSIAINNKRKEALVKLTSENKRLKEKVKYYKTNEGTKSLAKDRLSIVDEGESLIKYENR